MKRIDEENLSRWEENYGDIESLYKLKPMDKNDFQWAGWLFNVIEYRGDEVQEYQIYPYMVGYKFQKDALFYDYRPSVQSAIETAFNFYTKDPKSFYINYFNDNISIRNVIDSVENEYYFLFSYDNLVEQLGKQYTDSLILSNANVFGSFTSVKNQTFKDGADGGGMWNGIFHVYNIKIPVKYWQIKYDILTDPETKDRNNIYLLGGIISTILLLIILIPLSVKMNIIDKRNNESLYDKLKRKCNPANFIKNYDKEKVDRANVLYKELLTIPKTDNSKLLELAGRISNELDICLIEPSVLEDLKKKVNPKNFMKPYNPEKLEIANKLYAQLLKNGLSYQEFSEIEVESKKLI